MLAATVVYVILIPILFLVAHYYLLISSIAAQALYFVVGFMVFCTAGSILSFIFTLQVKQIWKVYCFDLLGAAAGAIVTALLLNIFEYETTLIIITFLAFTLVIFYTILFF